MSTGRIIQNNGGSRAKEPEQVYVSDGTKKYPFGHPNYFSGYKPDGMLLLNLMNLEYSEFRVDTDRDCEVNLYQHRVGSRYKLFVYRTTADAINISFANEDTTYVVKGTEDEQQFIVLNIEVAELNGQKINRIGATSEKLDELVASLNTNSIKLSEDITWNGTSQGSYSDGDTMSAGDLITDILRNMAQVANAVTYTSPSMSLSPSSTSVEAGTNVTPSIVAAFTQKDAGALNNYLLTLSTGGGDAVTLIDASALATYNQESIQVEDGQHLLYTAKISYDEGETKVNNMGVEDATGKITAGSLTKTLIYTGIRKLFYGSDTSSVVPTTSAQVRALGNSKNNPSAGTTFTITIPAGATRIIFSYPGTIRAVSSVKYVELGNADVTDTFTLTEVDVEGANGFTAKTNKVYSYTPAVAFSSAATYNVTI